MVSQQTPREDALLITENSVDAGKAGRQQDADDGTAPVLQVKSLSKEYSAVGRSGRSTMPRSTAALRDVNLDARRGEFISIVGPSGCGKSTLLLCILGLIAPSSGQITVNGVDVDGPGIERAIVFQQASLLPWRTILDNAQYGLELQGVVDRRTRKERATEALILVGLERYMSHYPHQLSGGMQQRVNLARALATDPDILLMDEPFGALDALTKRHMQEEVGKIVASTECTTIFITHDIDEAVLLGDRVLVMAASPGRFIHEADIKLERPRTSEAADSAYVRELVHELRTKIINGPVEAAE
jgi:NitT/TauT family transport system ATP-binding protein